MEKTNVMTPDHERWGEFINTLSERLVDCNSHTDKPTATAILTEMGLDVKPSLEFFESRGGYCDCEILLNVAV